jgi:hypothetical protein
MDIFYTTEEGIIARQDLEGNLYNRIEFPFNCCFDEQISKWCQAKRWKVYLPVLNTINPIKFKVEGKVKSYKF